MSAADLSNFKSALRTKMNDSLLKRINDVEGMYISKQNSLHTQTRVQPLANSYFGNVRMLQKRASEISKKAQFMKIDDGDTLKQFIQPLTYRLSKTIELNQK